MVNKENLMSNIKKFFLDINNNPIPYAICYIAGNLMQVILKILDKLIFGN